MGLVLPKVDLLKAPFGFGVAAGSGLLLESVLVTVDDAFVARGWNAENVEADAVPGNGGTVGGWSV